MANFCSYVQPPESLFGTQMIFQYSRLVSYAISQETRTLFRRSCVWHWE